MLTSAFRCSNKITRIYLFSMLPLFCALLVHSRRNSELPARQAGVGRCSRPSPTHGNFKSRLAWLWRRSGRRTAGRPRRATRAVEGLGEQVGVDRAALGSGQDEPVVLVGFAEGEAFFELASPPRAQDGDRSRRPYAPRHSGGGLSGQWVPSSWARWPAGSS